MSILERTGFKFCWDQGHWRVVAALDWKNVISMDYMVNLHEHCGIVWLEQGSMPVSSYYAKLRMI